MTARKKISGRVCDVYGMALYICLKKSGLTSYQGVREQMCVVKSMLNEVDLSWCDFLSHNDKRALWGVYDIFQEMHLNETLLVWLKMMLDAGRLAYIDGALSVSDALIMRGREALVIESAHELEDPVRKNLESFGKEKMGEASQVQYVINPQLLAGVRLRKGWYEFDMSLHSYLVKAKESII